MMARGKDMIGNVSLFFSFYYCTNRLYIWVYVFCRLCEVGGGLIKKVVTACKREPDYLCLTTEMLSRAALSKAAFSASRR